MGFTPDIDGYIIDEIIGDNDWWNTIDSHIFDDIFFESRLEKRTALLVVDIMNKVLAFCAENYYHQDGCDEENCPVFQEFTCDWKKYKCDLCKKNRNIKCDKKMTKEKATKIWHELIKSLPQTLCDFKCRDVRCPFYAATGVSGCDTQYAGIIYD